MRPKAADWGIAFGLYAVYKRHFKAKQSLRPRFARPPPFDKGGNVRLNFAPGVKAIRRGGIYPSREPCRNRHAPRNGQDRSLQCKGAAQANIYNERKIYAVGADARHRPGNLAATCTPPGRCKHRPLQSTRVPRGPISAPGVKAMCRGGS